MTQARDSSWQEVVRFLRNNGWKPLPSGDWVPETSRSMGSEEVNHYIAEYGWQLDIGMMWGWDFAYTPRYMHEHGGDNEQD